MHPISRKLVDCFKRENRAYFFGNGGSAAQSQHFAAELMGRFEKNRLGLPAISLTTDTSFLTAWSNDVDFREIFSRQVRTLAKPGDVVIGISTSGKSDNVLVGLAQAEHVGCVTIDFPRRGKNTAECQEYQLKLMHKICREVEGAMFP